MANNMRERKNRALVKALKAAGGVNKVAAAIGITASAVSRWEQVPVRWLAKITAMSGVEAAALRPYRRRPRRKTA